VNNADARANRIEPRLKAAGRDVVEHSRILRQLKITGGKIQPVGIGAKPLIADCSLPQNTLPRLAASQRNA
jgi:type I restriction enzyme R subunit